jgi:transcriptional regulator with XRE-family HTH domain
MQKRLALALRHSGLTQEQVAQDLGVDQSTVAKWEAGDTSNMNIHKASKTPPDYRVKLSPEKKEELVEKAEAGESGDISNFKNEKTNTSPPHKPMPRLKWEFTRAQSMLGRAEVLAISKMKKLVKLLPLRMREYPNSQRIAKCLPYGR